jgi:hypothetical protein
VIVAMNQIAGLGIRDKLARMTTWVGTSGLAAAGTARALICGAAVYAALLLFAVVRLTVRR